MSNPAKAIECTKHGTSYAAYVCQHLLQGEKQGYYCSEDTEDPQPDAWCYQCDQQLLLAGQGQWNQELSEAAQISVVCASCYEEIKTRNQVVRPNLDQDGWELEELTVFQARMPNFSFPSLQDQQSVQLHDRVKLSFLLLGNDPLGAYVRPERMWVGVISITSTGYVGILQTEPFSNTQLQPGAVVEFPAELILQIHRPLGHQGHNHAIVHK